MWNSSPLLSALLSWCSQLRKIFCSTISILIWFMVCVDFGSVLCSVCIGQSSLLPPWSPCNSSFVCPLYAPIMPVYAPRCPSQSLSVCVEILGLVFPDSLVLATRRMLAEANLSLRLYYAQRIFSLRPRQTKKLIIHLDFPPEHQFESLGKIIIAKVCFAQCSTSRLAPGCSFVVTMPKISLKTL